MYNKIKISLFIWLPILMSHHLYGAFASCMRNYDSSSNKLYNARDIRASLKDTTSYKADDIFSGSTENVYNDKKKFISSSATPKDNVKSNTVITKHDKVTVGKQLNDDSNDVDMRDFYIDIERLSKDGIAKDKQFNSNEHKITKVSGNNRRTNSRLNKSNKIFDENVKKDIRDIGNEDNKGHKMELDNITSKDTLNTQHSDLKIVLKQLQQQLIYQFAIKYKKISRVIFFTCRQSLCLDHVNFLKPFNMKAYNYHEILMKSTQNKQQWNTKELNNFISKIVNIDHLQEEQRKRLSGTNREIPRENNNYPNRRSVLFNANWLEEILMPSTFKQIVIVNLQCRTASRKLLEMASKKALFNSMYHWLLIEEDYYEQSKVDDVHDKKTNIACNSITSINGSESSGDKQPPLRWKSHIEDVFESNVSDTKSTEKFLEQLNININTELILAKLVLQRTYSAAIVCHENEYINDRDVNMSMCLDFCYNLYDIWNPGIQYGGTLNTSLIGNFTLEHGLQLSTLYQRSTTVRRRANMHMALLRCLVVMTQKNYPGSIEHYLTSHNDPHIDSMHRFNYALLSLVRDMFNLSFIISQTSSWGYLKNGKFDGMIGALVRKQADIGGSPIFFRMERAKVIDYTARTWVARPCFIFRHPRTTKKDRVVFLQPFTKDIWLYTVLFGAITVLLLWISTALEHNIIPEQESKTISKATSRLITKRSYMFNFCKGLIKEEDVESTLPSSKGRSNWQRQRSAHSSGDFKQHFFCYSGCGCPYFGNNVSVSQKQSRISLLMEAFLFYVGSMCQQGLSYSTRIVSGRCIVLTSILFSFAIYQFYLASIVGTLLMEKPKTIRSLRNLIRSSLEIGIEDIPYTRDFFLRTKDPLVQELYAKKMIHSTITSEAGRGNETALEQSLSDLPSNISKADLSKSYRNILHSHETGAHAKVNEASNWYEPEVGVRKIQKERFAFHVDVATAYKIIADTFTEKEICDLTEIELFPTQKMMSIVQKDSPLRKMITYGLRRVSEVGITDYQRRIWHSPKPRCVKQLHTEDLQVDLQTFTSALVLLSFGSIFSLLVLSLEIMHKKLCRRIMSK